MRNTIAVFGSAVAGADDEAYQVAIQVGRTIGVAGFNVLCGGYAGVMEAVCQGCSETGGQCSGIGLSKFSAKPNKYISQFVAAETLGERLDYFERNAQVFLALSGGIGTITEVMYFWDIAKAGLHGDRPILLFGEAWPEWLKTLKENFIIDKNAFPLIQLLPDLPALEAVLSA